MKSALNIMTSMTETQQRKKQSWHVRDPQIRDAVRYCVTMRLSEKESLEELSNSGYTISYRTFRRIKSELEPNKQRLDKIIEQTTLVHIIKAFDKLDMIEQRLLELLKTSKTVSEQLNITRELRKNSREILELCDSNPVIASLLRKLKKKERNDHVEKPT